MKEKIIDIYENDKGFIISFIKKEKFYIIEKCYVKNNIINLICKYEYKKINEAKNKFNKLKED